MYQPISGVALRTVKYSDTSAILSAWTAQLGHVSLLMPAAASRESRRRRALTMPMSLFQGVVDVRPGHPIMAVRDMRAAVVTPDITANPVKATVAIFLADLLDSLLRDDSMGDAVLWQLIEDGVRTLDSLRNATAVANFHLWFMYRLGTVLGIEPDVSTYGPRRIFDLRGAVYRTSAPGHSDYLEYQPTHSPAAMPWLLSRLTPRTLHLLRLTADQRNTALDTILRYYTLHSLTPGALRSLDVLRGL